MNTKFSQTDYLVRKKILSFVGGTFHIYDRDGQLVLFSQMKAFKLKEDIRLYGDETMQEELISIQARSMIDFSATYDVMDSLTGEQIGSLRRKGMKSILKDEWIILDPHEREIGRLKEDSALLALLRRFLSNLIPQKFNIEIHNTMVAVLKQNFNPFVSKMNVDFSLDRGNELDRRLGLAAAVLLLAIEGKQG